MELAHEVVRRRLPHRGRETLEDPEVDGDLRNSKKPDLSPDSPIDSKLHGSPSPLSSPPISGRAHDHLSLANAGVDREQVGFYSPFNKASTEPPTSPDLPTVCRS